MRSLIALALVLLVKLAFVAIVLIDLGLNRHEPALDRD